MLNPYLIIVVLFIVSGLIASVWGWMIVAKGRQTLRWPAVDGVIERADPTTDDDDLLPHIEFSYSVAGQRRQGVVEFPAGTTPTPELATSYLKKYPVGTPVRVHYDPAAPERATLEPGPRQGDWLVFAFGVTAIVIGIVSYFAGMT